MSERTTRRAFLQRAAATAAVPLILSSKVWAKSPNETLNIAFVGTGGMGGAHVNEIAGLKENCPCYCDVDTGRMGGAAKNWPQAKAYQDYRVMLEKERKNIDAVMVGTPDHHHYPATVIAMELGLHVYTQKPLVQTVWEARQLARLAAKNPKLVTQMGNQGHGGEGWRRVVEWVHSGKLGQIREVHTWTDRPIWPQGIGRPEGEDPVPPELNWDIWLGPSAVRPFKRDVYHPFKWRGWWEFGAGALGDMACHNMDGMFWALEPGPATTIEPLKINEATSETFPKSSVIKWSFPATAQRRGFAQFWYDGGLKPEKPEGWPEGQELPSNGTIFVGNKGIMFSGGAYGDNPLILPESIKQAGEPEKTLPRSIGHYKEWVQACKGEGKTWSNFGYAAPMTETILLGNVAMHVKQKIEWDAKNLRVKNVPEANRHISKEYRKGWKV